MRNHNVGPSVTHPLYHAWLSMRHRCRRPKHINYRRYGARGITVCHEWDHFWTFVFDMGPKPTPAHSLDRINNDGPYAPWNCRWATCAEQQRNGANARLLTHNGETLCLADWAKRLGITQSAISHRIRRHGVERALEQP